MSDVNKCKECKYNDSVFCMRAPWEYTDNTGEYKAGHEFTYSARDYDGVCGPRAKLYEPHVRATTGTRQHVSMVESLRNAYNALLSWVY